MASAGPWPAAPGKPDGSPPSFWAGCRAWPGQAATPLPRARPLLPPLPFKTTHAWGSKGQGSGRSRPPQPLGAGAGAYIPRQGMLWTRPHPAQRHAAPCTRPRVSGYGRDTGRGAGGCCCSQLLGISLALLSRSDPEQSRRVPAPNSPRLQILPTRPAPLKAPDPTGRAATRTTCAAVPGVAAAVVRMVRCFADSSGYQLAAAAAAVSSPGQLSPPRQRGGNLGSLVLPPSPLHLQISTGQADPRASPEHCGYYETTSEQPVQRRMPRGAGVLPGLCLSRGSPGWFGTALLQGMLHHIQQSTRV